MWFITVNFPEGYDEEMDISFIEFMEENYKFDEDEINMVTQFFDGVFDENDGYVDDPNFIEISFSNGKKFSVVFHPGDIEYYINDKMIGCTGSYTNSIFMQMKEKKMYFEEKDIELCIDGMGIVFFSQKTTKDIPEGIDFFNQEYSAPADVSAHLKKGDVVGFCTGSGGNFILKFREGYPDDRINNEYSVCARLGIEIKDDKLCMIDLFWLMEWSTECPKEQILNVTPGYYHITLCTKCPESGIWGDKQTIYVYLNKLDEMPELTWEGVPQLFI